MKSGIKDKVNQRKAKKRQPTAFLKELLLKGPVMTSSQLKAFKKNRKSFEAWPEK